MPPRRLHLATALALSALAACSAAPAPQGLSQGATGTTGSTGTTTGTEGGAAGTTSGGAVPTGTTGAPAPTGTSGRTAGGGATGAASGSAGSTSGTSPGGGSTGTTGSTGSGGSTGSSAPTRSRLFTPAEDRIGITPTSITMCAHAALTYGAAFNTKDTDFNVFWQAVNTEKGGIYGREVAVTYENDNYDPNQAVTAATACKAKGIFMLLGGIGFDQIPAVRNWAETNRMLYLHHTATVRGSAGLRFSFTELPSVERMGEGFGQLYLSKYKGKKVGIIERDSANWKPGADLFKDAIHKAGITEVADNKVVDKKQNYTQDILDMKNAGAEVVFLWENALNSTEFITQAKRQNYNPRYLMFPFNLTSQTLGNDALTPALDGVAMYPAYSNKDYSGSFSSYADDIKLFEAQYAKYDPGVDLSGVGGDLLFLNWTAQKALYAQFLACGKDCTRNRFVDVLQSYKAKPTSSSCLIDFTKGDGQHGAEQLNFMETYTAPSGKVNWRNTQSCVGRP